MDDLTFGQVMLLYDGMMHYLVKTNPWGSGEGEAEPAVQEDPSTSSLTQPGTLAHEFAGRDMLQGGVTVRHIDTTPAVNRDIVEKLLG